MLKKSRLIPLYVVLAIVLASCGKTVVDNQSPKCADTNYSYVCTHAEITATAITTTAVEQDATTKKETTIKETLAANSSAKLQNKKAKETNCYTTTTTKAEIHFTTTVSNSNKYYTEQDIIDIAKVIKVEAGGIPSQTEQACVAWTILNRVDNYNSSVYKVVRAPSQFAFYEGTSVRSDLYNLSKDVLDRWSREKNGETDVGRVLPKEYMFFTGDGRHNYFRTSYSGGSRWNYSLPSPYSS